MPIKIVTEFVELRHFLHVKAVPTLYQVEPCINYSTVMWWSIFPSYPKKKTKTIDLTEERYMRNIIGHIKFSRRPSFLSDNLGLNEAIMLLLCRAE